MLSTPKPTAGGGVFTSTSDFFQQEWCWMNGDQGLLVQTVLSLWGTKTTSDLIFPAPS